MISAVLNSQISSRLAPNGNFDPFEDHVLLQQAKSQRRQSIDLRTLSPFQRALLSIDGTVTKFIEAYMLEPVEIIRLQQHMRTLRSDHQWLSAPEGTNAIARQVLLCGKYSNTVYAYAVSLLIADRLPDDVLRGLDVEPAGLGRLLLNSHLENRREVLWYGLEQIDELPEEIEAYTGSDFISRTYRIIVSGQPIMLISEKFPISRQADSE